MSEDDRLGNADLNDVIASVGQHVFSYLPLGSVLNGFNSPALVNTAFRSAVIECLGQAEELSFSRCPHLRRIDDAALAGLAGAIGDGISAGRADGRPPRPALRLRRLDLSRCRTLTGRGVRSVLGDAAGLESVVLSGASRVTCGDAFPPGGDAPDGGREASAPANVRYVSLEGCSRVDAADLNHARHAIRGVRHLDLSGVSTTLDDECVSLLTSVGALESLSLAGSKRITAVSVGVVCRVHRSTLKRLNLSGCEEVYFMDIMWDAFVSMLDIYRDNREDINDGNYGSLIPRTYVQDTPVDVYGELLCDAIDFAWQEQRTNDMFEFTRIMVSQWIIMKAEEAEASRNVSSSPTSSCVLFQELESLDISLIGNRLNGSCKLHGAIPALMWLNGGRLRDINLCGLERNLLPSTDIKFLLEVSNARTLNVRCTHRGTLRLTSRHLSEIDYSHGLTAINFPSTPSRLISAKLDYAVLPEDTLTNLLRCTTLLNLSVRGSQTRKNIFLPPATMNSSDLLSALSRSSSHFKLLQLDCRDIEMDLPLSALRSAFPSLLRLNGRSTKLGTKLLKAHHADVSWRVGARKKETGKRKRSDNALPVSSADDRAQREEDGDVATTRGKCSLLRTGFCQSKETEQEMFACMTCGITFGRFVCLTCSRSCHEGHDVQIAGFGPGYCDCCLMTSCKCMG